MGGGQGKGGWQNVEVGGKEGRGREGGREGGRVKEMIFQAEDFANVISHIEKRPSKNGLILLSVFIARKYPR